MLGLQHQQIEKDLATTINQHDLDWKNSNLNGFDEVDLDLSLEEVDKKEGQELVRNPNCKVVTEASETVKLYLMFNNIDTNIDLFES